MTQRKLNKTNKQWYPYEEFGSYYRLEDGTLMQCAMNIDGTRDDNFVEVDWDSGVPKTDEPRMKKIVKELQEKA